MYYAYVIYGLMFVIEFVVLANLFNVVRNLLSNENISQKAYILHGVSLLLFSLIVALVSIKLAQLPSKEWQNWFENVMSFWRTHKVWHIWTFVVSVLGIFTMGLLGMILIPFCDVFVEMIMKLEPMHGDSVWPVAIMYSVFLPWLGLFVYLFWHKFLAVRGYPISVMTLILVSLILLIHLIVRLKTGVSRTG